MAEERETALSVEVAEAVVRKRSGPSLVWLIPLVAALVGAWLAWRAFTETGPEISISFKTAEGLEAGKTKVKFKDLEVGVASAIDLSEDLSHVVVTAQLKPGAERYLTENTRFWVVRPQVSAGRITGLGTLFSGAYIGMDPVAEGREQLEFVGLESAPVVTAFEEGALFTLRSEELGSLEVGVPVFFRQFRVGQVATVEMDESGDFLTIQVFVRAPHDDRVRTNTRFWNASGLDVTLDARGVRLDSPSFVSMLIGGIAFDLPPGADPGPRADDGEVFRLYASRKAARERSYAIRERFMMYFSQSVQGLVPGSPVVFRGIQVGEVTDVSLEIDRSTYDIRVPVVIEIAPERLTETETDELDADERLARLVEKGMRAQLGLGNLLTGQLEVQLDFHPSAPPAEIATTGPYPEIPTVPTPLEEITAGVADVIGEIRKMPLEQIGKDLQLALEQLAGTLTETNALAGKLNADVTPALSKTLEELESTVSSVNGMVAADSPLNIELRSLLRELNGAARSARLLADYLERHPEALLQGKKE